jgi:hypothetical protein
MHLKIGSHQIGEVPRWRRCLIEAAGEHAHDPARLLEDRDALQVLK